MLCVTPMDCPYRPGLGIMADGKALLPKSPGARYPPGLIGCYGCSMLPIFREGKVGYPVAEFLALLHRGVHGKPVVYACIQS